MKKEKYVGDISDTDSFGGLFMLIGGILISFGILNGLEILSRNIEWFDNFLVFSFGFLLYYLGFYIKRRDVQETINSIRNILWIIGLILFLLFIILFL
ncbi:hypothetical protein HNV12_01660 [Methanococcoides sp. SA1]|nr:hypothetical protein [Methanococcoides sp. SA1]